MRRRMFFKDEGLGKASSNGPLYLVYLGDNGNKGPWRLSDLRCRLAPKDGSALFNNTWMEFDNGPGPFQTCRR